MRHSPLSAARGDMRVARRSLRPAQGDGSPGCLFPDTIDSPGHWRRAGSPDLPAGDHSGGGLVPAGFASGGLVLQPKFMYAYIGKRQEFEYYGSNWQILFR